MFDSLSPLKVSNIDDSNGQHEDPHLQVNSRLLIGGGCSKLKRLWLERVDYLAPVANNLPGKDSSTGCPPSVNFCFFFLAIFVSLGFAAGCCCLFLRIN